ncbi:MAG: ATP-binding domain-containing protein, partial [Candidatus Thiodiazotropha endolucinida]|nr:ATP-binding domain-containing protein [Candidatus Thiodiazotropha taylori]MCW4315485.1 ATP-binding domain-containing protein [Candidatus Thiodiazotropha taylori]
PDTNSLLLLYDDAQSIYSKKSQLDFSLSSVGVQARGRTKVLKLNYRNTDEILAFSYGFACRYLSPSEKDDDYVPLIAPEGAGRHGPKPVLKTFDSFDQEAAYIAHLLGRLHKEQGIAWSDMSVVYRSNWMGEKLKTALERAEVPVHYLGTAKAKKQLRLAADSIKLMTMHSSKGLEFPVVAISGVGYMPAEKAEKTAEAKLLYVAMTRATEKLLLTSHQESEFFSQLLDAQAQQTSDERSEAPAN